MSEIGKAVVNGVKTVENTLASIAKDLESGVGSFFSGSEARSHTPEAVREPTLANEQSAGQERWAHGQVIDVQDVNGKPSYLVQTENAKGEPEQIFIEKGHTSFEVGQDLTLGWGKDGQLMSMEEERGYGI